MIGFFFASFCTGILAAWLTDTPFLFFWTCAFVSMLLAAAFLRSRVSALILVVCFFFSGAVILKSTQNLPPDHILNFTPGRKSIPVKVKGVIDSDPVYKENRVTFTLKVESVKIGRTERPSSGQALVTVHRKEKLFYGDEALISGSLYKPPYFRLSGNLNYRDYLKYAGIYSMMSVKRESPVKIIGRGKGSFVKSAAYKVRHCMEGVLSRNLPPLFAGIFNAVILGKREALPQALKDIFIRTGTVHIIAISGLHLGIIAFLTLIILRIARLPRKATLLVTMAILVFYCFVTGSRVPVIRATIMACILLSAYLFEREADIYNSLALAGFVILFINPWQFFSVSFQLSFTSIISIVYFTPRIKNLFPEAVSSVRGISFFIDALAVSLAAWIGLLPLIAYYFEIVSPVAILANIVIVPYLAVVIASGFLVICASAVFPAILPQLSAGSELVMFILLKIAYFFDRIPFSCFRLPSMPFYLVIAYYAAILSLFAFIARVRQRRLM